MIESDQAGHQCPNQPFPLAFPTVPSSGIWMGSLEEQGRCRIGIGSCSAEQIEAETTDYDYKSIERCRKNGFKRATVLVGGHVVDNELHPQGRAFPCARCSGMCFLGTATVGSILHSGKFTRRIVTMCTTMVPAFLRDKCLLLSTFSERWPHICASVLQRTIWVRGWTVSLG